VSYREPDAKPNEEKYGIIYQRQDQKSAALRRISWRYTNTQ
jgi:hypothetical protein